MVQTQNYKKAASSLKKKKKEKKIRISQYTVNLVVAIRLMVY